MISWRCAGTESGVREALRRIGLVMSWPGLTLHPTKTQLVNLRRGKEGFVFLGSMIRKKRSILRLPGNHFMQRWPSPKATQKIRDRVRELTGARQSGQRCEADHRRTERRASRLGTLLPNGECRSGVHQTGSLCRPAHAALAASPRGKGRHGRRFGPTTSSMGWVCIASKARCAIRRQPHHQDHR